ncbi:MAG: hypothetical protein ACRDGD_03415 [Candidatus Limnocylindria bacterium]
MTIAATWALIVALTVTGASADTWSAHDSIGNLTSHSRDVDTVASSTVTDVGRSGLDTLTFDIRASRGAGDRQR